MLFFQEMESELERFHKQNTQLELNITELRQKLKATDKELHHERQRVCKCMINQRQSNIDQIQNMFDVKRCIVQSRFKIFSDLIWNCLLGDGFNIGKDVLKTFPGSQWTDRAVLFVNYMTNLFLIEYFSLSLCNTVNNNGVILIIWLLSDWERLPCVIFFFLQVRDAEAVGKRMKTDIHNCVGFLQDPKKLKESIKTMFETHVHDDVVRYESLLSCNLNNPKFFIAQFISI